VATKKKTPSRSGASKRSSRSKAKTSTLDGQGLDIIGLVLCFGGVVAGLGMYADAAGPLGTGIDNLLSLLLGAARFLAPPAMLAAGVGLIRADKATYDIPLRYVVGGLLAAMAVTGFLHLFQGEPEWGAGIDVFGSAGGVIGLGVAGPLVGLADAWGATLVLLTMALLAVVVLTGVPVTVMADRAATGLRPVSQALRSGTRSLFSVGADEDARAEIDLRDHGWTDEPAADEPELVESPFDADAEPSIVPTPLVNVPEVRSDADIALDVAPDGGSNWVLPPLRMLKRSTAKEVDTADVEQRGRVLEAALAEHGVETRLIGMTVGPTVTRFELELGRGVKVSRVTSLQNDIAYAMASPDVRILAPIPGRQAIGVEVPRTQREVVAVGDVLTSAEARDATHPLEVAIGRDINGRSVLLNLATLPHILIAGQTGAGKSSGLNSIITSIMMRATPDEVRLVLIDPKRVEMGQYDRIPHLLTAPVTDPKKAANALAWAVREMERRYDLLSECGFRDIDGYNTAVAADEVPPKLGELDDDGQPQRYKRLPYIMVVVDELADLMMVAARDVEESICRLAQMARAVGIHLVIATQRPSVNVITGLIKANVPARLAFKVSSLTDSRVILDQPGAERLVGKGDMLLLGPSSGTASRLQGCWVEEAEVRKIVRHWRDQAKELAFDSSFDGPPVSTEDAVGAAGGASTPAMANIALPGMDDRPAGVASITDDPPAGLAGGEEDDDLLLNAIELVVNSQLGSTSMLQRKLRVGFARAGRLMDLLEDRGVVGPNEGSKAREVLWTPEQLEELKNSLG